MSETPDRPTRAPSFSQPPTVFVAVALSSGGWTDPEFGNEIALVSLFDGTAFVDVTDPINPIVLGKLDTHTIGSDWGDIKVYQDVAYIGGEAHALPTELLLSHSAAAASNLAIAALLLSECARDNGGSVWRALRNDSESRWIILGLSSVFLLAFVAPHAGQLVGW